MRVRLGFVALYMGAALFISEDASAGERPRRVCERWRVTIVEAKGLKNRDWGRAGRSDPYVALHEYRKGMKVGTDHVIPRGPKYWEDRTFLYQPEIKESSALSTQTPVMKDNTSPTWNHTVETTRLGGEGLQVLAFFIYDKDPNISQHLGVAVLDCPKKPGTYRLPLMIPAKSKRAMPGFLTVTIEKSVFFDPPMEKIAVPDLSGLSLAEAKARIEKVGLRFRKGVFYTHGEPKQGVFSQRPAAGSPLTPGSLVMGFAQSGRQYPVPNVVGQREARARRMLRRLNVTFQYDENPGSDTKRWFKIVKQSIAPGQRVYRTTPIRLTVCKPPAGTEVEMPNVVHRPTREATRILYAQYLRKIATKRMESEPEKAGRVLEQTPAAGEEIAFDDPGGVLLSIGYHADGLSFESAKAIALDTPFSVTLTKENKTQYRRIDIEETGYLILESQGTVPKGLFPLVNAYDARHGEIAKGHTPRSIRVEPGLCTLAISATWVSAPKDPFVFQCRFLPEFDSAEPNDTLAEAASLSGSSRLTLGFATNKDHDYYRFSMAERGYLMLRASAGEENEAVLKRINPSVAVLNADGKRLARGVLPHLQWLPAGDYFVCFYGGGPFHPEPCHISVEFQVDEDRTEPNDTIAQATPLPVGQPLRVRYASSDLDHYRLQVEEPGYVIVSHPRKLGPWTTLEWVKPDGQYAKGQELPCAVYVEKERVVALFTEEKFRPLASYDPVALQTQFVPLTEDEHEPNDTIKQAKPVPTNEAISGLIIPSRDVDCFRFSVRRDGPVRIGLAADSPKFHMSARLYDQTGKLFDRKWRDLPWKTELKQGAYVLEISQWAGIKTFSLKPYRFVIATDDAPKPDEARSRYQTGETDADAGRNGVDLAQRAYAHYCRKEYRAALPLYEEASELIPGCAAVWNDMGACCVSLDDLASARTYLEKAIDLKEGYALALRNRGVVARKEGDVQGYLSWTEKAVEAEPDALNLRFHGHALLMLAGQENDDPDRQRHILRRALQYYERSQKLNPKDPYTGKDLNRIRRALEKTSE